MSERRKTVLKIARILSGILLAGAVTLFLVSNLWLTPFSYQVFAYTVDLLMPSVNVTRIPAAQIGFYEGVYMWSMRLIDTVFQGVAIVAAAIGAAILFRVEKEREG
ncbi:MAG: hypothetical protein KIH01_03420 [Candidatus Freyarchaeota archaeon]|nr:hypothetical protein [Candidatus Jordarchaeia archaeon]